MNKTAIISISLLVSLAALGLSVKTNQVLISQCVTQSHWQDSLEHFFVYGDIFQTGERKLIPKSLSDYYRDRLDCINLNSSLGTNSERARQLELLPKLQFVEKVIADDIDSSLCVELVNETRVCQSE